MPALEDQIKTKLGIKYSAAKQLIADAKKNLEITDGEEGEERADEIIDEATQIFEDDLLPEEQEAMKVSGAVQSDWQQRAKAAAKRKESQQQPEEQPQQQEEPEMEEEVVEEVVEEYEDGAEEGVYKDQGQVAQGQSEQVEIIEEIEGDAEDGVAGTTITETQTTEVAQDGTKTITTKTVKKKVAEDTGTKMVCFCTIL